MQMLWKVRHVSVSIERAPREVYELASNPELLPRWASGLATAVERTDGEWTARAPMGKVKIRFAENNEFGVLDHDVTLESGLAIHNPMRVLPNGSGSEVVFTVFQRPGTSDATFAEDADRVTQDLLALKRLLER
jgi:hypothetical protein